MSEVVNKIIDKLVEIPQKLLWDGDRNKLNGDEIIIDIKLSKQGLNDSILIGVKFKNLEGTIGVWIQSLTMDISIFSSETGESFFEFHEPVQDLVAFNSILDQLIDKLISRKAT